MSPTTKLGTASRPILQPPQCTRLLYLRLSYKMTGRANWWWLINNKSSMRIQMRNSESAMQCFRLETPTQVTSSRSCQSSRTTTTLTTLVEALWPSILLFRRSEEKEKCNKSLTNPKDGKCMTTWTTTLLDDLLPSLSQRREWKYRLSNIMQQCHTITNSPYPKKGFFGQKD